MNGDGDSVSSPSGFVSAATAASLAWAASASTLAGSGGVRRRRALAEDLVEEGDDARARLPDGSFLLAEGGDFCADGGVPVNRL